MPVSYLKRPLFLALAAYMIAILLWRCAGGFKPASPETGAIELPALAEIEGLAVSALGESRYGEKFQLRALSLEKIPWKARVLVRLPKLDIKFWPKPGESLLISGWLYRPQPAESPGGFDEQDFLGKQGIGWVMKADAFKIEPIRVPWRWRPFYWSQEARASLETCLRSELGSQDGQLMTGLVLGYKGTLESGLNQKIQDAGVMHLLVPSGTKMAIILAALWVFGGWLTLPISARWVLAALIGGFYLLAVGAEPPYLRAYLAALALMAGLWAGRDSGAFQAMTVSAFLILLWDPRSLFSTGFQMTYLAAGGLIVALPKIRKAVSADRSWLLRRLWTTASATFLVQALLWPVLGAVFKRAALLGALANIPLIPLSAVLMAFGFGLWPLSRLGIHWLCAVWVAATQILLAVFRWVCAQASSWPGAAMNLSPLGRIETLAYYAVLAVVLAWPWPKRPM